MKRLFSCLILFIFLLTSLPLAAAAQEENYVWVLKEVIEYNKTTEIEDYNTRNAGKYSLKITGSRGSYVFTLQYLGKTVQDENGRTLKEGDSASSAVVFGEVPKIIKPGELTALSVELRMISNNTYDKAYDFLPTKAAAFFDKQGARPDIPSSSAVYFSEKEDEKKGTTVGTKSGQNSTIATTLYAQAPSISDDQKIALCVCAEGVLTVGTKYVYELINEQDLLENDIEQPVFRKAAVRDISGTVYSVNGSQNSLKDNDVVSAGTSVKTEADAKCELYFDDQSYFKIFADSELLLSKAEVKETVVKLIRGKAWAYIQPIVYGGSFTVELTYADLKIKGTIFAIEEGEDYSSIWLFTGTASVVSAKTNELTDIEAGQKATFYKDGTLQLEYFSVTENIGQWGIPKSAIREDSGYSWVRYFIICLIVLTAAVFSAILTSIYIKKQKKKKSVSDTAPKEGQCQFCGSPLQPDDTFCKNCGAAVKKPKSSDEATE